MSVSNPRKGLVRRGKFAPAIPASDFSIARVPSSTAASFPTFGLCFQSIPACPTAFASHLLSPPRPGQPFIHQRLERRLRCASWGRRALTQLATCRNHISLPIVSGLRTSASPKSTGDYASRTRRYLSTPPDQLQKTIHLTKTIVWRSHVNACALQPTQHQQDVVDQFILGFVLEIRPSTQKLDRQHHAPLRTSPLQPLCQSRLKKAGFIQHPLPDSSRYVLFRGETDGKYALSPPALSVHSPINTRNPTKTFQYPAKPRHVAPSSGIGQIIFSTCAFSRMVSASGHCHGHTGNVACRFSRTIPATTTAAVSSLISPFSPGQDNVASLPSGIRLENNTQRLHIYR